MTLAAFLAIAGIHLLAAISPGPAFVVSLRVAAADGFRSAAALAIGFGLGAATWAALAMTGIALAFELVPALFVALKFAGVCFLLLIAFSMWRHAPEPLNEAHEESTVSRTPLGAIRLGYLTFLSNPKSAVFFGAVFIGLVPPETPALVKAALVATIFVNETLWYVVVAKLFSTQRARAIYRSFKLWIDRSFGVILAALGAKIALT